MRNMRNRFGIGLGVVVVALATTATLSASGAAGASAAAPLRVREFQPTTSPATRARLAKGAPSVPMWSHTYKVAGTKYKISMVGNDPFTREKHATTTVPTQIIPIKITFSDTGDVYDPTAANSCLGGATALDRTLASPVFKSRSYK